MPETRQDAQRQDAARQDAERQELTGPAYSELGHRDPVDWHHHDVPQLLYLSGGVLSISAAGGTWVVPPQRAVWIPAGVPHAHRAHGRVQMRTLAFPVPQQDQE